MNSTPESRMKRKQLSSADISGYNPDIETFKRSVNLENLRKGTLHSYLSYLRIFSAWLVLYCGMVPFAQVTVEQVRAFVEFLKNDLLLAPNTINGYLASVRKMFHCIRDEELSKRVIPDLAVDEHLPRVPSAEHVLKMLKACLTVKERLIIGLLITTGVRIVELINLKFSDIRTETKQIYISADTKGRADGYVPLSSNVVKLLTAYCREYNAEHPGASLRPDDYIFFNPDRSGHESSYQIRKQFIQVQLRAGLEEESYRPHAMRHYFALQIYLQSHDLFLVKRLLRHKTLSATLKYLVMATSIDIQEQYLNPGDLAFDKLDMEEGANS